MRQILVFHSNQGAAARVAALQYLLKMDESMFIHGECQAAGGLSPRLLDKVRDGYMPHYSSDCGEDLLFYFRDWDGKNGAWKQVCGHQELFILALADGGGGGQAVLRRTMREILTLIAPGTHWCFCSRAELSLLCLIGLWFYKRNLLPGLLVSALHAALPKQYS